MKVPLISIITPSFNRAHLLPRLWESLRHESVPMEWIVVDDASLDATSAVVEGFDDSRIVYLRQAVNQGSNIARNVGVRASTGRFILFLDSDDELAPNALAEALQILEAAPATVGALLMIAQPTYRENHRLLLPDGAEFKEEDLIVRNRLYGDHAVLYKREVFLRQMLPEEYRECQFVFVFGISRWWSYRVVNKPLTLVHRQQDNLSQARSISRKSRAAAMGWEAVLRNHAEILGRNPGARIHLYGKALYKYSVAGDWKSVQRVFHELRSNHPGLLNAVRGSVMTFAGVLGRCGADYLRIRWIRWREETTWGLGVPVSRSR